MSLLRDVEFSEHVLVEGIVNVDLDPAQTNDALLELFGELAIYGPRTGRRIHFCNNRIGPPSGLGVVIGAH